MLETTGVKSIKFSWLYLPTEVPFEGNFLCEARNDQRSDQTGNILLKNACPLTEKTYGS